ncbi:methyl-accepting chemotaxis protein [Dethiothermospora halolimnae]|uniref:methyl-accepting chemotaxis protein n=1 Tax=Dethiothermospora halolimnae TaxID=3114390 RepID=UPI003CCBEBEA
MKIFKRSLKTRLFSIIVLSTILPVLILSLILSPQIKKSIGTNIDNNLKKNLEISKIKIKEKEEEALFLAERYASNSEIVEALKSKDREKLSEVMKPIYNRLKEEADVKVFEVEDKNAIVFLRAHGDKYGDDKSDNTSINSALKGKKLSGFESGKSGLAVRGFAPIKDNGEIIGVLQVGFDDSFLNSIDKLISGDMNIYIGNKLYKTSNDQMKDKVGKDILKEELRNRIIKEKEVELMEDNYVKIYRPIQNPIGDETVGIVSVSENIAILLDSQQQLTKLIVIIVIIALLISIGLAILFSRSITNPINKIKNFMGELAKGNLDKEIDIKNKEDEVGQLGVSAIKMSDNIKELIKEIKDTSKILVDSSAELEVITDENVRANNEVANTANNVVEKSHTQITNTEKATTTIEEMTKGVGYIAKASSLATESAISASNESKNGDDIVKSAANKMNLANDKVDDLSKTIKSLDSNSEEIGKILGIINGISEEINLLSLNAAIEAARAGEQGKGFAVVADEIGKLANQSEESAVKIINIIKEMQNKTKESIEGMELVNKEVKEGTSVVNKAREAFKKIAKSIEKVSGQIQEVSATAEELSASSDEIYDSVENINNITKNTGRDYEEVAAATEEQLASMEEIASSAEQLNQIGEKLNELVARFNV